MKKSVAFLGLVVCVFGCGAGSTDEPAANSTSDPLKAPIVSVKNTSTSPHVAEIDDPKLTVKALLWNERAGYRISRHGFLNHETEFYHPDGYEHGGEEKFIKYQPCPNLAIYCGNEILTPENGSGYSQKLDFDSGVLTTTWVQKIGGQDVRVRSESAVQRNGNLQSDVSVDYGVESEIQLQYDRVSNWKGSAKNVYPRIKIKFLSDPDIKPKQIDEKYLWATQIRTGKTVRIQITHDYKTNFFQLPVPSRPASIEIDGPLEDQQFVNSTVYYLCSVRGQTSMFAASPLALSGTTYNGHVFWDADIWVFPALSLIDPDGAASISKYRLWLSMAARDNFHATVRVRSFDLMEGRSKIDALQFPWESAVTGKEVCPTEARKQHHITASVVHGLSLADDLGLADSKKVQEVGRLAANFYQYRSVTKDVKGSTKMLRTIRDTMSPDEFHIGDDDLYTNIAAEQVMRRYGKGMENVEFFRPSDEKSFLNYSNDRLRGYKQAAGVLAIYPLQDPAVEKEAKVMLERFADKVTENGPAMSDSVHALIWARLGETEKAYQTWHKSWKPFTQHPLLLFSEKKRKEVTYFTTGAAGSLQTVLYGFLGFRLDYKKQPGAAWSTPLRNGRWLSVKPNLPKEWKKVTLRNFSVLGKRYTLTATHTSVNVSLEKN